MFAPEPTDGSRTYLSSVFLKRPPICAYTSYTVTFHTSKTNNNETNQKVAQVHKTAMRSIMNAMYLSINTIYWTKLIKITLKTITRTGVEDC